MKTIATPAEEDLPLTASGRVDGRSARKIETRRRIIDAASDLFAEQGFAGTSMDEIAETAGVSKGTIFYNFKNKSELFEQLIRHASQDIAQEFEIAREGREGWDSLVEGMWRVMELVERDPSSSQIVLNELFRGQRPWSDSLADIRLELLAPIDAVINEMADKRERMQGARALSPDETESVAMSMLGALIVAALDHRAFGHRRSLREVHNSLVQSIHAMKV